MQDFFNIDERIKNAGDKALEIAKNLFAQIDKITEYNQNKVLKAFIDNNVCESSFGGSTGYGNGDRGRDTLEEVYAKAFHTEAALVRPQITCGTHALALAQGA